MGYAFIFTLRHEWKVWALPGMILLMTPRHICISLSRCRLYYGYFVLCCRTSPGSQTSNKADDSRNNQQYPAGGTNPWGRLQKQIWNLLFNVHLRHYDDPFNSKFPISRVSENTFCKCLQFVKEKSTRKFTNL